MGQTKFYFAEWMAVAGITKAEVARRTGFDPSYITQLWTGPPKYDKVPSVGGLEKLGNAMGIHPSAFSFHPDSPQGRVIAALLEPREPKRRGAAR